MGRNKFGKSGQELADAFEEIANSPGITTEEALEILEIDLEPGIADTLPELDADQLHAAAAAIRAGAIPALWPWIWYIPWISYAPPGGDSS